MTDRTVNVRTAGRWKHYDVTTDELPDELLRDRHFRAWLEAEYPELAARLLCQRRPETKFKRLARGAGFPPRPWPGHAAGF